MRSSPFVISVLSFWCVWSICIRLLPVLGPLREDWEASILKQLILCALFSLASVFCSQTVSAKERIDALYIPLADHYALIVAYEKYGKQMHRADLRIKRMGSWPALRTEFLARNADVAMVLSPMAMKMYQKDPSFRWISLIHRNGLALAVNDVLGSSLDLSLPRAERKPGDTIAAAFSKAAEANGARPIVAVPSLQSTHMLVFYKFLRDHGLKLAIGRGNGVAVARAVAPPKSPNFLQSQNARDLPAAFVQSLPWADVVETTGKGKVAWYSKDILPSEKGHIDCIMVALDEAVSGKSEALKEVVHYIHRAGRDIEAASAAGPDALREITAMIRKHIPQHSEEAILASLDQRLKVIGYHDLAIDTRALGEIMELAVEAGVMPSPINLEEFADDSFSPKR